MLINDNQKLSKDNRFNIDLIYPVGSIYMSVNDVNPSNLFGGEWEAFGQGKTLVGVGTYTDRNGTTQTFSIGEIGGDYIHRHKYGFRFGGFYGATILEGNDQAGLYNYEYATGGSYSLRAFQSTSSQYEAKANAAVQSSRVTKSMIHSQAQAFVSASYNASPYITVYMWKRTR